MPEDMSEYMPEDMSDRMPEDMSEYMPEDMPDRMPDWMPDKMSDRVPEDMPDRMPEDLPDRMPEDMPEDMPDHMPEDMPDRMPNRMSEDMSDRMPEDLPVRKCINVMVGITRSKVICLNPIGHRGHYSPGQEEYARRCEENQFCEGHRIASIICTLLLMDLRPCPYDGVTYQARGRWYESWIGSMAFDLRRGSGNGLEWSSWFVTVGELFAWHLQLNCTKVGYVGFLEFPLMWVEYPTKPSVEQSI